MVKFIMKQISSNALGSCILKGEIDMGKLEWTRPATVVQKFETNEYVGACVKGTIQCSYPGRSKWEWDDGTSTYTEPNKAEHGLCGNDSEVFFNDSDGKGYEAGDPTRLISISGTYTQTGTYYNIKYRSSNDKWKTSYTHNGKLFISEVSGHS